MRDVHLSNPSQFHKVKLLKEILTMWRIAVEEEILRGVRGEKADLHRKGALVRRVFGSWSLLLEVKWRKDCIRRIGGGAIWMEEWGSRGHKSVLL